jgi:hypothetical protein
MRWIERYGLAFVQAYLGAFNLVSGLNYFLHFWPQPIPADPIGATYMQVTLHMGMFQAAKVLEVVGGASLLLNICTPFGLVLLFPVTATVFLMNVFFSPLAHVQVSGARNFAFHVLLFAAYGRYYLPLLNPMARRRPIWRGEDAQSPTPSAFGGARRTSMNSI